MSRPRGGHAPMVAAVAAAGVLLWRLLLDIDSERVAALTAVLLVLACFWLGRRQAMSWLSPPMLYLSVFALFHLGMAAPWALGLYSEPLPLWFVSGRLTPALALVALALAFYLAGLLWAGPQAASGDAAPVYTNRFLFAAGLGIYLAGCAMFIVGLGPLGGWSFFDVGYAETYRLTARFDPRLFGTSFTIVPIGLYLAAAAFARRWRGLVIASTLVWVGGIFFLGFRGFALIPGLVVLGLLDRRGCRLPRWMSLALVGATLAAIPLARQMREEGVWQRSLTRSWGGAHWLDGIVEMGGSLRPLVHTLAYLENERWRWGWTYWRSLGTVWPNLSPEWGGGRYIPFEELPPNHWLTSQAEPGMYRQYGGLGFSAVAEPYMNFGAAGVAAYFLLLGAGLGSAARASMARPLPLALGAVVLGPLLWTTRNSFEIFFRPAVWGVGIVLAVWLASPLARAAGRWLRASGPGWQPGVHARPVGH